MADSPVSGGYIRFNIRPLPVSINVTDKEQTIHLGENIKNMVVSHSEHSKLGARYLSVDLPETDLDSYLESTAGLHYDRATHTISGTPTKAGVYKIRLKASVESDSLGKGTAEEIITLKVIDDPVSLDMKNDRQLIVLGNKARPVTLQVPSDARVSVDQTKLPSGLTYNAQTKTIEGTPTVAGQYDIPVTVTSSSGNKTITKDISIDVVDLTPQQVTPPTISVKENNDGTHTITITQPDGQSPIETIIKNGKDGETPKVKVERDDAKKETKLTFYKDINANNEFDENIDTVLGTSVIKDGADGQKGEQGIAGPQGVAGPKGDKGDPGEVGPQGVAGPKGDKGDPGEAGPQGVAGPKGDKGDPGEAGPQGVAGAKGEQGEQGQAGRDGKDGETPKVKVERDDTKKETKLTFYKDVNANNEFDENTDTILGTLIVKDGQDGAAGPKGDTGEAGPQGVAGPKGDKGDPGEVGPQGVSGPKGDKGDSGAAGAKGEQGEQGQAGRDGKDGETPKVKIERDDAKKETKLTFYLDKNGNSQFDEATDEVLGTFVVKDGETGPKGDKGDPGVSGQNGIDGKDGISPVITLTDNNDGSYTISVTNPDGTKQEVVVKNGKDGKDGTCNCSISPSNGTPTNPTSTNGIPSNGTTTSVTPSNGSSTNGTPTNSTPSTNTPGNNTPVGSTTIGGAIPSAIPVNSDKNPSLVASTISTTNKVANETNNNAILPNTGAHTEVIPMLLGSGILLTLYVGKRKEE